MKYYIIVHVGSTTYDLLIIPFFLFAIHSPVQNVKTCHWRLLEEQNIYLSDYFLGRVWNV
jgi:hypothetical protein